MLANQVAGYGRDRRLPLLNFDIHAHTGESGHDFVQRGNDNSLSPVGIGGAAVVGPVVARVQLTQFGKGHLLNQARAVGGAVNGVVVDQNQSAVAGGVDVHFQHIDVQGHGPFHGQHRVAREKMLAALVGQHRRICQPLKIGVGRNRLHMPGQEEIDQQQQP